MTRFGKSTEQEEFEAELNYNMLTLKANLALLKDKGDLAFARSLCDWFFDKDYLSPKQMYHACRLWQEVNSLGAKQEEPSRGTAVYSTDGTATAPAKAAERPIVQVDGSKLITAFDMAAQKIKYPHMTYKLVEGIIRFYRTGHQSKKPGTIVITDGFPYPQGKIYAQILRDGTTVFNEMLWGKPEQQQELKRLIENFVEAFAMNGKEYNTCCYCGRELTDPASVHAGYGPICAANYGLPWGEVPEKEVTLDIL